MVWTQISRDLSGAETDKEDTAPKATGMRTGPDEGISKKYE